MRGTVARKIDGGRTGRAVAVGLIGALALTMLSVLASPAANAVAGIATANVQGHNQELNTKGQTSTILIDNKGGSEVVASVRITRPSTLWTVTGCPKKPAGWNVVKTASSCEFTNVSGADIPIGGKGTFAVTADVGTASENQGGSWLVETTRCFFGECPTRPTDGDKFVIAFSFKITNGKILFNFSEPPPPGAPCSSVSGKTGFAGGSMKAVICGKNLTNIPQTITAGQSTLSGSFISATGALSSGPVPPTASGDVVLGTWDVTVSNSIGTGKYLDARVGSDDATNSLLTTLWGFNIQGS